MLLLRKRNTYVVLNTLPSFQIHGSTGRCSKPSTLWTIPVYPIVVVFWRLFCSHGTVCTLLFMPQYNYSHTHVLICLILDNLAHTDNFFCCFVFEFPFIVKLDMRILMKYSQDVLFYRQKPRDCNTKYLHNHCPVIIISTWECDMYQRSSPSWIKNVTWNAYTTHIYFFGIYCLIYINHFIILFWVLVS
jgi:hypothetical protein